MVKKEYHNANRIFHCALIYGMISGGVAAIAVYLYACFGMKGTMENRNKKKRQQFTQIKA